MAKPLSLSAQGISRAGSRMWQKQHQRRTITSPTNNDTRKPYYRIPFEDLQPTDLAAYWDTEPPLKSDILTAQSFFEPSKHLPIKLFSAAYFRTMPYDSKEPEVAFLGRSNVGKSSLINAILGKNICRASSTPGRTKIMNAFGIGGSKGGGSKIVLLDMPGYGKASDTTQGEEILKYLQKRKQLRRTYVLIDALHGLKDTDKQILSLLRQYSIPHQVILSKVDRLLADKVTHTKSFHDSDSVRPRSLRALQELFNKMRPIIQPDPSIAEGPGALGEIISCCAPTKVKLLPKKRYIGVDAVKWSIMKATGFDGSIQKQPKPQQKQQTKPEQQHQPPVAVDTERVAVDSDASSKAHGSLLPQEYKSQA